MMTYSNKFVICVLVNGRPVKEKANGTVCIPFGEFSLRLRNKNNRRALATISIDGENVSAGGYIVPANDFVDIERWADKPVKFKFVSLDSEEAVDFGKNGPNEDKVKGTIEARFFLEKETPQPVEHHHHHHYPKPYPPYYPPTWTWGSGAYTINSAEYRGAKTDASAMRPRDVTYNSKGPGGQSTDSEMLCGQCGDSATMSFVPTAPTSVNYCCSPTPVTMDGCTVEGNYSNQSFRTVWFDAETDYVALKLFLQGYDEKVSVAQPIHRGTSKSRKIRELEEENERLREQVREADALRKLEEENKELKKQLPTTGWSENKC